MWICAGEYRGRSVTGFLAYVSAKVEQYTEDLLFRQYISDGVMVISQNTCPEYGQALQVHFIDVIGDKKTEKEDTRTGEEIAEDVVNRLGLKQKA